MDLVEKYLGEKVEPDYEHVIRTLANDENGSDKEIIDYLFKSKVGLSKMQLTKIVKKLRAKIMSSIIPQDKAIEMMKSAIGVNEAKGKSFWTIEVTTQDTGNRVHGKLEIVEPEAAS